MTKYRVFKEVPVEQDFAWQEIGDYDATDAKAAIRSAVLALPSDDLRIAGTETFAATPAASWRAVQPNVAIETKVTFA